MRTRITRKLLIVFGIGLLMGSAAATARAEVNLNINIGAPPPVVVEAPPTMLFLAEPGVYVAVGISYDIFFVGGRYYYIHDGHWFWAPGYGGPWVVTQVHALPPGLQKYKVQQLHGFRDREYKVYKAQGPKYKGRTFVGNPGHGPGFKDKSGHSENPGKGRGRGRD